MRLILSSILMLFLIGMAYGENVKGKMNPKISLPSEIAGWKWDGKEKKYNSRTLFDYINGAAELYLAYGFQGLMVRRFEKIGQPPILIEVYEMASSEDAYGVFSFEHQDEPVGIGQGSEFGGGLLRFWKGRHFISVYAEGEGSGIESAILSLGRATAEGIPTRGPEPTLIQFLPGRELGLVDKSVRYLKSHVLLNQRFFIAHQNILNLSRNTEAVLATYLQADKQRIWLLVIRYPSSKDAAATLRSFKKIYLPEAGEKDRLKTEDRKWTFVRQQKDFLLLVFGAPTEAHAEALLKATEEKLVIGRR